MKNGMEDHVRTVRRTMFEQSTAAVKRRLMDMVKEAENKLEETTSGIFNLLERDYRSIFGGNPKQFSWGRLSREEDKLREVVKNALIGFEDEFKKVATENMPMLSSDEGMDGIGRGGDAKDEGNNDRSNS